MNTRFAITLLVGASCLPASPQTRILIVADLFLSVFGEIGRVLILAS
jgi:hypothetical protein